MSFPSSSFLFLYSLPPSFFPSSSSYSLLFIMMRRLDNYLRKSSIKYTIFYMRTHIDHRPVLIYRPPLSLLSLLSLSFLFFSFLSIFFLFVRIIFIFYCFELRSNFFLFLFLFLFFFSSSN